MMQVELSRYIIMYAVDETGSKSTVETHYQTCNTICLFCIKNNSRVAESTYFCMTRSLPAGDEYNS